jgi:hypothetical protein
MTIICFVLYFITSLLAAEENDFEHPISKDFGLGVQVDSIQYPLDWNVVAFNNSVMIASESRASSSIGPFACYNPCGNVKPCRISSRRSRKCPKNLVQAGNAENGLTPI